MNNNQIKNNIVFWLYDYDGGRLCIWLQNQRQIDGLFFQTGAGILDDGFRKEIINSLRERKYYHRDHDFGITLKKLADQFQKEYDAEWHDFCDGNNCRLIYLRDYLREIFQKLIKVKNFLCRIRF